jgi:hypothetical protein
MTMVEEVCASIDGDRLQQTIIQGQLVISGETLAVESVYSIERRVQNVPYYYQ